MPSSSFLPLTLPARQPPQYPRQRPKYSAARAFYISILLISAIALWSIATYRDIGSLERESHRVFRRADVIRNELAFGDASKKVDLEASLAG